MSERLYYRNDDEFNTAFDAAVASIRTRGRHRGGVLLLWWLFIVVQIFFYVCDWAFDWELYAVVPGVDLRRVFWLVIVGGAIFHHVRTRTHHERILKDRLCLQCGVKLAAVETDEAGDGVCPGCMRAFNTGEYRRPAENRGSDFQGYLDADHFDKAVNAAAERIKERRGMGFEASLMGWLWIALGVVFGLDVLLDWEIFEFLPGDQPWITFWFGGMLIWGGVYSYRVKKIEPEIVPKRLCFDCGYSLLGTPVDANDVGRCPECGVPFALGQYVRPPEPEPEPEPEFETEPESE
ncbi:MAG: hypothetical protein KJO43_06515 [Phycisphaerae bacterium]|nr:hypothetical protein [Phycisphaerae bacterium]NNF43622.1 hypothetical protein [Phycisphaerales bacterium]